MYSGALTDIEGLMVGHAQNKEAMTGCSVVLCPMGATAGVAVRGAAPGTRETDLLNPENTVEQIQGILLAGGSAYGLEAAYGVMKYLEEKKIGFGVGDVIVPIVPGAVLYDLGIGDPYVRPDKQMGYEACRNAMAPNTLQGSIGAGTGATAGKLLGFDTASKSGLGTVSIRLGHGVIVAAMVAANPVGDVVDYKNGKIIAGAHLPDGTIPGTMELLLNQTENKAQAGGNTTIGVIATNAKLTKAQANRLANVGHDGIAWAIRPAHLPMDGDTLFALSAGDKTADFTQICAAGMEAVARAINNAILAVLQEKRG